MFDLFRRRAANEAAIAGSLAKQEEEALQKKKDEKDRRCEEKFGTELEVSPESEKWNDFFNKLFAKKAELFKLQSEIEEKSFDEVIAQLDSDLQALGVSLFRKEGNVLVLGDDESGIELSIVNAWEYIQANGDDIFYSFFKLLYNQVMDTNFDTPSVTNVVVSSCSKDQDLVGAPADIQLVVPHIQRALPIADENWQKQVTETIEESIEAVQENIERNQQESREAREARVLEIKEKNTSAVREAVQKVHERYSGLDTGLQLLAQMLLKAKRDVEEQKIKYSDDNARYQEYSITVNPSGEIHVILGRAFEMSSYDITAVLRSAYEQKKNEVDPDAEVMPWAQFGNDEVLFTVTNNTVGRDRLPPKNLDGKNTTTHSIGILDLPELYSGLTRAGNKELKNYTSN